LKDQEIFNISIKFVSTLGSKKTWILFLFYG
jgi:hypothetical protein